MHCHISMTEEAGEHVFSPCELTHEDDLFIRRSDSQGGDGGFHAMKLIMKKYSKCVHRKDHGPPKNQQSEDHGKDHDDTASTQSLGSNLSQSLSSIPDAIAKERQLLGLSLFTIWTNGPSTEEILSTCLPLEVIRATRNGIELKVRWLYRGSDFRGKLSKHAKKSRLRCRSSYIYSDAEDIITIDTNAHITKDDPVCIVGNWYTQPISHDNLPYRFHIGKPLTITNLKSTSDLFFFHLHEIQKTNDISHILRAIDE